MVRTKAKNVKEYIELTPKDAQKKLKELRSILKKVAPRASEAIKWGAPVFEDGRILFAYAAYRNHLNFMPTSSVLRACAKKLTGYAVGKGSVQFLYDQPLPVSLIRTMALLRVKEVKEKDARWM